MKNFMDPPAHPPLCSHRVYHTNTHLPYKREGEGEKGKGEKEGEMGVGVVDTLRANDGFFQSMSRKKCRHIGLKMTNQN